VKDIDHLEAMARMVRDAVMDRYPDGGGGDIVGSGEDGNITREIDLHAEAEVIRYMQDMGLTWNLISEERGNVPGDGEKTLILDPIDGTYNAMHGIPLFSTSMAIADGPLENITTGLVMNVPLGKSFAAVKGEGAKYNGREIKTRPFDERNSVFNSFLGPTSLEENRLLFSWPYRGRYFGSISLEVCYVAKGAIDLFALFYRIPRITDVAGSFLILNEAGGRMLVREEKKPWTEYRPSLIPSENRDFLVMGDGGQTERILGIITKMNPRLLGDQT